MTKKKNKGISEIDFLSTPAKKAKDIPRVDGAFFLVNRLGGSEKGIGRE